MNGLRAIGAFALVLTFLSGLAVVKVRYWAPAQSLVVSDDKAVLTAVTEAVQDATDVRGTRLEFGKAVESEPASVKAKKRLTRLLERVKRLEQQYAELASEQKSLRGQFESVNREFQRLSGMSDGGTGGDNMDEEHQDSAPDSEDAEMQEQVAKLEDALAVQTTDPSWSIGAVERITEVFDQEALAANKLIDIKCATTLCRLEVAHSDEESRGQLTDQLFPALGWGAQSYLHAVDNQDGTHRTIIFISREGYALEEDF
jgi:hypothetical protein